MWLKYALLGCCCLSSITVAAAATSTAIAGQPAMHLKTLVCPSASDLNKNLQTNRWSALGGTWQGTTSSLATKIDRFVGAEWQGINLGQPFCIYKGIPASTFAIPLAYHVFAVTPSGGKWQGNKHQNLFQCVSNNVNACLFQVRIKPKALSLDQQLAQIKPGHYSDDMVTQGF